MEDKHGLFPGRRADFLPDRPADRDALVKILCARLECIRGRSISGRQLASELGLPGTRALRRLVAHARVHGHRHEIVGVPGQGYFWGPAAPPEKVAQVTRLCERMGRCWFFISCLLRRGGTAMALVQMVFNFVETRPPDDRDADDLAALMTLEGTSTADFLDRFVAELGETPEGRQVLAKVGEQHAALLLPEDLRQELIAELEGGQAKLQAVRARLQGLTPPPPRQPGRRSA